MIDAGWSDCGTPKRLFRAMETTLEGTRLLARLRHQCPNLDGVGAGALQEIETRQAN
jgi:hypothetical protein